MQILNNQELEKWLASNSDLAINLDPKAWNLNFAKTETRILELPCPETPLKATYFARAISMIGIEDSAHFSGALLWISAWDLGSSQLVQAGWKIIEKMRIASGENRPLDVASAHVFRSDELIDLQAFVLVCLVFGWDAFLIPFSAQGRFVNIRPNDHWYVHTRTQEAFEATKREYSSMDPIEWKEVER
jgi:hypothetical protein